MSHLMICISLLAAATFTSVASTLIMFAMIGEINRKKNDSSQIPYFNASAMRILREYRALYPRGAYSRAFFVSVTLTGVLFILLVYLVFGVFAGQAPPSR